MNCTRVSSEKLRQEFELVTYLGFVLLHWDQKHLSQEASELTEMFIVYKTTMGIRMKTELSPDDWLWSICLFQHTSTWTMDRIWLTVLWKGSIFLGNVTKHSQISYLQKSFMVRTFTCLKWWQLLHQTGFKVRLEQRRDTRKFPQQEKWDLSAAHPNVDIPCCLRSTTQVGWGFGFVICPSSSRYVFLYSLNLL